MSTPASRSASPPRSAPVQKRKRQPRPPPTHPPYVEMIRAAIAALKERGGSSRQKILQYILANFDVGNETSQVNARVRNALRSGVEKGVLLRSANAKGANGSFRIGKALAKKGKKSPKRKGKSPRKVKRSAAKSRKSPKKKAARKSPKKRRSPKKKAARKPARKPKRRSPKKKAAKPARRSKAKAKSKARARR